MLDRYPMNTAQTDKYGCAIPFNEVAQYFNRKLKEAVVQLREDLPTAAITYVDVYTVKYTLISQARKNGNHFSSLHNRSFLNIDSSLWSLI